MAFTEKYVTNAGAGAADGTSLANAWSWATMLTSLSAGQRANVQGAITRTTSSDTFANVGTAANPIAIRGINSTLNDLEANGRTRGGALVTTNFPVITYTTGSLTLPVAMLCEHIKVSSARSGATLVSTSGSTFLRRVVSENTHASSATATGVDFRSTSTAIDCDFSCASSSTSAAALSQATAGTCVRNCLLTGNTSGCGCVNSSNVLFLIGCVFRDAGFGVSAGTAAVTIIGGSFRNITNIYLRGTYRDLLNNVAWGVGGSSQWFSNAGVVTINNQSNNFIGNMGVADADEGNWPTCYETTLTADPFVSSTDLTLNNTSGGGALVRAAGYPAYLDGGAWQHQDAGGGGGMIGGGNLSGGFQ